MGRGSSLLRLRCMACGRRIYDRRAPYQWVVAQDPERRIFIRYNYCSRVCVDRDEQDAHTMAHQPGYPILEVAPGQMELPG